MPGTKTNEREGTRAVLRHARVSPYKVREVLDLVRNKPVAEAQDILRFTERDAGILVGKLLASAVANASHNDQQDPEELYLSACFADEGTTIKRWRPRARGRATRIRKRTSHITVIVSRLPDADLVRLYARREAEQAARRARRVAGARKADATSSGGGGRGLRTRVRPQRRTEEEHDHDHDHEPAATAPAQTEPEPVAAEPTEAKSDETEKGV
ncbi:MAG: 50S ribosomal protein L22 [Actinomycetota bacterium]|nr:50S ribosomal protein L22 [Actinomycetota bacterium]